MRYAKASKICFLSIKGHQIYELKYYIAQEKEHGVTLKKKQQYSTFLAHLNSIPLNQCNLHDQNLLLRLSDLWLHCQSRRLPSRC